MEDLGLKKIQGYLISHAYVHDLHENANDYRVSAFFSPLFKFLLLQCINVLLDANVSNALYKSNFTLLFTKKLILKCLCTRLIG
jgi:hypothetical protein